MSGIQGMAELRARLDAMKAATQDLEPALVRAGVVVLKAAMDRIDAGGPGWAPNKTRTPLLHKTGRLLGSLTVSAAENISRVDGNEIIVGTNVEYARYLQLGTSGSVRQRKQNRIAGMLGGAGFLRASGAELSGGLPPRPFLFIDSQVSDTITAIFARHVMGAPAPGA